MKRAQAASHRCDIPPQFQGGIEDTIVLCPYCGSERGETNQMCCDEIHCERHHVRSYICGCVEFYSPRKGKTYKEPCEETQVRLN